MYDKRRDPISDRVAPTAYRQRVQRGRMLADDGLRDTPASALILCWRTTCSQLARFRDCWQRGMQPGQPGRYADCSSLPTQRTDCSCDEILVH